MVDPISLAGPAVTAGFKFVDLLPIIWLQLGFPFRTRKHIKDMMSRLDQLTVQRNTIQGQVDANRANGALIRPEVEQWLKSAAKNTAEACNVVQDMISSTYLTGCRINFYTTYKLNKKAVKISKTIDQLLGKINIGDGVSDPTAPSLPPAVPMVVTLPPPPPSIQIISTPNFMAFQSVQDTMQQIFEALADKSFDLVGVFGMGGVGKTTIVKQIGKRASELGFVKVVMVTVSQNVNIKKIQDEIASHLELKLDPNANEDYRAGQLRERIAGVGRLLLILDDVWKWGEITLELIGISDEMLQDDRCKILVTTRKENVCSTSVALGEVREKTVTVSSLSKNDSWALFRKYAGEEIDGHSLNGVAKDVIKECRGLPLALVVVGKALHGKDNVRWEAALKKLKRSQPAGIEGVTKELYNCLKLSYDFLEEDDEVARSCFLMCCLFPEDYDIDIRTLTIYAHGKGSFRDQTDRYTIADVNDLVYDALERLKESSLLLEGGMGQNFVAVHDVVRDVGISIASKMGFLIRTGAGLSEWPDREKSSDEYTCISLMANHIEGIPENLRFPKLEVLSLRGNELQGDEFSSSCFDGMTTLRVLDLSLNYKVASNIPNMRLKCLTNLRTLLLEKCWYKDSSLSVVGELESLEILSLRGTFFVELPTEIGNLRKLRSLDLTDCSGLRVVPANVISRLSNLEELQMGGFTEWAAEESESAAGANDEQQERNAKVSELASLHSLKKLDVHVSRGCSGLDFALPNLEKFCIYVDKGTRRNAPIPWEYRYGLIDERPMRFSNYLNVMGVPLLEPRLLRTLLPKVHSLSLAEQKLNEIFNDSDEAGRFNVLKFLWIKYCDGEEFGQGSLKSGSFKNLECMHLQRCSDLLVVIPYNWVQNLQKLEELHVHYCPEVTSIIKVSGNGVESGNNTQQLASLRQLRLSGLPNLRSIYVGPQGMVNFSKLVILQVEYCREIVSIFSPYTSRSLQHLQTLHVIHCSKLRVIFEEDETGEEGISDADHIQPPQFPNLKSVTVADCGQLTSVFNHVTTAQSLQKLEMLVVAECDKLVHVIDNGIESETSPKSIEWPHLLRLKVRYLPEFTRFCPSDYTVNLLSLEEMHFGNCNGFENLTPNTATTDYGLELPDTVELRVYSEPYPWRTQGDSDSD